MSAAPAPYNVSLSAASPLFQYTPSRDGDVLSAWNASYTDSSIWPQGGAAISPPTSGVAFRRTQSTSARVSITFEGSALYLCFATGGAGYALTLDNALVKTTIPNAASNPICAAYAAAGVDTLLYSEGLGDSSSHTALLQVSAATGSEFKFFGGQVTMGVTTNGKVVNDDSNVDDQDSGWSYTPTDSGLAWDRGGHGRTLFNTTSSFDCNYGATVLATYTFSDAGGVILRGNVWPDAHAFSVTLDDKTTNMDASSSWEDGQAVFFMKGGLDPTAQHTITLRDFNSDVPDCNRGRVCCVALDAITLLKAGSAYVRRVLCIHTMLIDYIDRSLHPRPHLIPIRLTQRIRPCKTTLTRSRVSDRLLAVSLVQ
ncbi:hypothetical protein EXIGLDRAFT_345931 [Exidia glandulosa HHB12029]|uniref:Uncharacterized protein n=1 Tax=Exidia glandulosa HHB12029 TaxID=1314781 RepID=A0A165CGJ5_EXIGL|nr:hypothetical protein EXIGLDRAFT_345931 [Exidia glandulosa HHB12029]